VKGKNVKLFFIFQDLQRNEIEPVDAGKFFFPHIMSQLQFRAGAWSKVNKSKGFTLEQNLEDKSLI